MLVVRVTENVRAVQSSYYSSCPWPNTALFCKSQNLLQQLSNQQLGKKILVLTIALALALLTKRLDSGCIGEALLLYLSLFLPKY
jgi:hypothetical protein